MMLLSPEVHQKYLSYTKVKLVWHFLMNYVHMVNV